MRLGVLFSGGKDSTLALHKTAAEEEVTCLITLNSTNPESFMFHTPNINVSRLQAEALGLPLIERVTEGKAEKELDDLEEAINEAVREYALDGIVSGAIESVYQAERIQRVCNRLEVWSFNPLWKSNQVDLLREIVKRGFKVIISGIFAYPLDAGWLGRELDESLIKELVALEVDYGVSPSGEGGEIETTVLDAPLFRKKIDVEEFEILARGNTGVFNIKKAKLTIK